MEELEIRQAVESDLPAVVAMLADDPLGATRESPDDLTPYTRAFQAMAQDANQRLCVAVRGGEVVGVLQLTLIPGLSRAGMTRGLIEGVRVHRSERGEGLGATLTEWAVEEARRCGCGLVQLTSDISREEAHRFYERLGFQRSHYGFKRVL